MNKLHPTPWVLGLSHRPLPPLEGEGEDLIKVFLVEKLSRPFFESILPGNSPSPSKGRGRLLHSNPMGVR